MPRKTAAQVAEDAALMAGMEADITDGDEPVPVATLEIAYGEGEPFRIGPRTYELAPFATKNLKRGYALLDQVPTMLSAQALAAKEGQSADLDTLTEVYNVLAGRSEGDAEKPLLDREYVAQFIGNYPMLIADQPDALLPALDLAVLALSRRHPDICCADIEDEFDLGVVVRLIRAITRVNTGLKDTF